MQVQMESLMEEMTIEEAFTTVFNGVFLLLWSLEDLVGVFLMMILETIFLGISWLIRRDWRRGDWEEERRGKELGVFGLGEGRVAFRKEIGRW